MSAGCINVMVRASNPRNQEAEAETSGIQGDSLFYSKFKNSLGCMRSMSKKSHVLLMVLPLFIEIPEAEGLRGVPAYVELAAPHPANTLKRQCYVHSSDINNHSQEVERAISACMRKMWALHAMDM